MTVFVLAVDPRECAKSHCDAHVNIKITQIARILCTVLRSRDIDFEKGYKSVAKRNAFVLWAQRSPANYAWLKSLALELNQEYRDRWGSNKDHKSAVVIRGLPDPNIPGQDVLTSFPQKGIPSSLRSDNPVDAYRKYYVKYKKNLASWKTEIPGWWREHFNAQNTPM